MLSFGLSVLLAANSSLAQDSCTQPGSPPVVISEPAVPSIVDTVDEHGTTELIVTLTPQSARPASVVLSSSSGNTVLDAVAMDLARKTTFAPETRSCAAIGGQYFYDIDL
jgi:outer membrane biosynthesis protein TonB